MYAEDNPSSAQKATSISVVDQRDEGRTKKQLDDLLAQSRVHEPSEPRPSKRRKAVGFKDDGVNASSKYETRQRCVWTRWWLTSGEPNSSLGHPPPPTSKPNQTDPNPAWAAKSSASQVSLPRKSALDQLRDRRDSMLAAKGRDNRRDRTFVGSICAACEEPLEHTLRGERILQLSCGHVSHEACFYEYIKEFEAQTCPTCDAPLGLDTSRGGNLDFENLNRLVRSMQSPDPHDRARSSEQTPVPWETDTIRQRSDSRLQRTPQRATREHLLPEPSHANGYRYDRQQSYEASHGRNTSGDTAAQNTDYGEMQNPNTRRHDYDVQSMETALSNPRHSTRNPIPTPSVVVRSEFPSVNRSRNQQSLTCLVTVEVGEGKWRPHPEDLRSPPPVPPPVAEEGFAPRERPAPTPLPRTAESETLADSVLDNSHALEQVKDELFKRVDNWHGLDCQRFGRLLLHGMVRVGKDKQTWQDLDCYLFTDMLICVKEKRLGADASQQWDESDGPKARTRCTLKGSILIKKHLNQVEIVPGYDILTLNLSVAELPAFHLQFRDREQLETWRKALLNINRSDPPFSQPTESEQDTSATDEDDYVPVRPAPVRRISSLRSSSRGAPQSQVTAPTEYTNSRSGFRDNRLTMTSIHVPLDIVVVIPSSPSMHGLKVDLLRDSLRFLVSNLGERDRMGLVTFGSANGGVPLVSMTNKHWGGWNKVLDSIRPLNHKTMKSDVVEGANAAMDLLMQRRWSNSLSHIILISDCTSSDPETVDFVVSRAEAAKIAIHSFGLGLTHKPDILVELSTRTKASYVFVKDWMMLRECLAGCLGALQSTSHQNAKLTLRLPEGSPAKIVKISGALQIMKRSTGRDAEASLGDLRFGDKRDVLVQLAIQADNSTPDSVPTDPWESLISNLEALGPLEQEGGSRPASIEELPLLQADLSWGDILREGHRTHLPRPSLLAITMLPPVPKKGPHARPPTPPIPPHPSVVQRRMELLTSDMLSRALNLVTRGQHDRASHLLAETRLILKGLGKGGLPPLPFPPPSGHLPPTPRINEPKLLHEASNVPLPSGGGRTPSPPPHSNSFHSSASVDSLAMLALDSDLEASLEYMTHPAVFTRDSRKAVLQAIGVISSQRGYSFRTPTESLWAGRIPGVRRLAERSREWREAGEEALRREN